MRKSILQTFALLGLVIVVCSFAAGASTYISLRREAANLRAERGLLVARLNAAESMIDQPAASAVVTNREPQGATPTPEPAGIQPVVMTNSVGRKMYIFAELFGSQNQVMAREAQFREILGFTKLAFHTADGPRLYDVDDLHPEVLRSLGYDAGVLKRALTEAVRRREFLAEQAQLQADLRFKAAAEATEREKAGAERIKAEAALREAKARERLADAAERAASNPPRPQTIQRFVIVGGGPNVITNKPPIP